MIRFTVDAKYGVAEQVKVVQYPVGEFYIQGPEQDLGECSAYVRGHDPSDLILLNLFANYVHRNGGTVKLWIPYFPSAREDRGNPLGVKVYADMINLAGCEKVTIVDPHSDVTPALVKNCEVIQVSDLILGAIWQCGDQLGVKIKYEGVIAPDGGAAKRAWAVAQALDVPMYQAGKHRDVKTGKLSGFWCEPLPDGPLLIVDDICDGGGTFIGLADACHHDKLDLWVTHGIFTGDNLKLEERFVRIHTTDSFKTPTPANAIRHSIHLSQTNTESLARKRQK